MPSKLEYELNKLRGEVTATGKIYTSSIAVLQDALEAAEKSIKDLTTDGDTLLSRVNKALGTAQTALASANGSIKKSGGTMTAPLITQYIEPSKHDTYSIGDPTNYYYFIHSDYETLYGGLYSDIIAERTGGAGVTVDSVLLKDGRAKQSIVSLGEVENITVAADGTITPTKSYIRLETNGGAATDILNHINLDNFVQGDIIVLTSQNAAHDVTVNDNVTGAGLIYLEGNANFTLTGTMHTLFLMVIDITGTKRVIEINRFNG